MRCNNKYLMLEIVFYALLGVLFGTFTGIAPGIHINTVCVVVLGLFYKYSLDPVNLSVFVVSLGVTHSFVDFVPSVYLGAPDPDTVLFLQPSHQMLLRGRGFEAVALSVAGGVYGMIIALFLIGGLVYAVPVAYSLVRPLIPLMLVLTEAYLVAVERNKIGAVVVVMLSGIYGALFMHTHVMNQEATLFVMLTSLFGISSMVMSSRQTKALPPQKMSANLKVGQTLYASFLGFLGGLVAGVMPGLGSSQSAIVIQKFARVRSRKAFIVAIGTINTVSIVFSVFSLYLIGKARSGSAIAIEAMMPEISLGTVGMFLGAALFSTGIAGVISLKVGQVSAKHVHKVNYRVVAYGVAGLLFLMTFFYAGGAGIVVCVTGTAIGILPHVLGTKKSLLMSSLIFPTILYLTGNDYVVLGLIGL